MQHMHALRCNLLDRTSPPIFFQPEDEDAMPFISENLPSHIQTQQKIPRILKLFKGERQLPPHCPQINKHMNLESPALISSHSLLKSFAKLQSSAAVHSCVGQAMAASCYGLALLLNSPQTSHLKASFSPAFCRPSSSMIPSTDQRNAQANSTASWDSCVPCNQL